MFFPISPNIMIYLYDAGVYRLEAGKSDCCEVYDNAEALKLNELQWLSALGNVYYSSKVSRDSILSQAKRFLPRRRTDLTTVEEFPHSSDSNRSLITMRGVDIKTRLRPSFVKIKKSMKKIPLPKREQVRSPYLMIARGEFNKQVEAGNYREEDFLKFLADLETS